jgi:hypothetical protein
MNVYAENILFNLKVTPPAFNSGIKITKVFGGNKLMTVKKDDNNYEMNFKQFGYGEKKTFLCELEIPPAQRTILDHEKLVNLAVASCTVTSVDGKQKIHLQSNLQVTMHNPGAKVQVRQKNQRVQENFYRVKTAEVMYQAIDLADDGKHADGKTLILEHIKVLETLEIKKNSHHIQTLITHLNAGTTHIDTSTYKTSGRHKLVQRARLQMQQRQAVNLRRKQMAVVA